MAWTQSDVEALEKVIGTGVLSVKYADRVVTYQSTAEMRVALADMRAQVAKAAGTSTGYRLAATKKGF